MITACALVPTHTVLSTAIFMAYMPSGQHLRETLMIHMQISLSSFTRPITTALALTAASGGRGQGKGRERRSGGWVGGGKYRYMYRTYCVPVTWSDHQMSP